MEAGDEIWEHLAMYARGHRLGLHLSSAGRHNE